MALKKCRECGNDVSTEAAGCPRCGAVVKKKWTFLRLLGAAFLLFLTLVAVGSLITVASNTKSATPPPAVVPEAHGSHPVDH